MILTISPPPGVNKTWDRKPWKVSYPFACKVCSEDVCNQGQRYRGLVLCRPCGEARTRAANRRCKARIKGEDIPYQKMGIKGKTLPFPCRDCGKTLLLESDRQARTLRCKACHSVLMRKQKLAREYGITVADYEELLREQGGVCATCKEVKPGNLRIDHDHATGKIRGLLCHSCNVLLGLACDSEELLLVMVEYLRRSRA